MSRRRESLLMASTEISPPRTAGEIIAELVKVGANEIHQSFDAGKVVGLRWVLTIHGQQNLFEMPVRTEGVFQLLQKRRSYPSSHVAVDREKAERIAWRQLLRWVQAQIAMIQTGMAQASEVFLPYWKVGEQTLFQAIDERRFKALPAPEREQ